MILKSKVVFSIIAKEGQSGVKFQREKLPPLAENPTIFQIISTINHPVFSMIFFKALPPKTLSRAFILEYLNISNQHQPLKFIWIHKVHTYL